MPHRNLFGLLFAVVIGFACHLQAEQGKYAHRVSEVIRTISTRYVDPVDPEALFEGAMSGMTRRLDPYSSYIPPTSYSAFRESLDQEFGGVGILVGLDEATQRLTVRMPLPGKPAERAGVRAGDQILEIDGVDTTGFTTEDAVDLMRGPPGTPVRLRLRHSDAKAVESVELVRAVIEVESVMGDRRDSSGRWIYELAGHPGIMLVRITAFGELTARELSTVLSTQLPAAEGLILDLRGNGGGLLSAAVDVSDLFLREGLIVSVRGRDPADVRNFIASTDDTLLMPGKIPVAVLIDGDTASAAEIVAASLQDHDAAKIVGERSFGKGTVQNLFPLEMGRSALKLTVATYWRPSGKNIHRRADATEEDDWGVRPDSGFDVPLDPELARQIWRQRQARDLNEDNQISKADQVSDPQLSKAIEYVEASGRVPFTPSPVGT